MLNPINFVILRYISASISLFELKTVKTSTLSDNADDNCLLMSQCHKITQTISNDLPLSNFNGFEFPFMIF